VKRTTGAAERNAEPILAVLRRVLPPDGLVLEIASGSGFHATVFARALPALTWQPSDVDADGIAARADQASLPNLRPPVRLDVTEPWPVERVDAIVCINMLHITPWACALALLAGAARVLRPGGVLVTYGPYRFDGSFTADSNAGFDSALRARDAAWGVRDVSDLEREAVAVGLTLAEVVAMPVNNHTLVFRR
jgi:SAM-dependent methyltransferase